MYNELNKIKSNTFIMNLDQKVIQKNVNLQEEKK